MEDKTVNPGLAEPEMMRFGPCLPKPRPQVLCGQTKQKGVVCFYFLAEESVLLVTVVCPCVS